MATQIERWDIFEVALDGPSTGNPFVEVQVGAKFRFKHREIVVDGFYDGNGVYRVRLMPDTVGEWTYETFSNVAALDGKTGELHLHRSRGGQSWAGPCPQHLPLRLCRRHAPCLDRHHLLCLGAPG